MSYVAFTLPVFTNNPSIYALAGTGSTILKLFTMNVMIVLVIATAIPAFLTTRSTGSSIFFIFSSKYGNVDY